MDSLIPQSIMNVKHFSDSNCWLINKNSSPADMQFEYNV